MQDDNRYDQGYRRREPGRNDRDDELRASRRYGDPDHPGMISDRGACRTVDAVRIIRMPSGIMMMLAKRKTMYRAYIDDARSVNSVGPGLRPFM